MLKDLVHHMQIKKVIEIINICETEDENLVTDLENIELKNPTTILLILKIKSFTSNIEGIKLMLLKMNRRE